MPIKNRGEKKELKIVHDLRLNFGEGHWGALGIFLFGDRQNKRQNPVETTLSPTNAGEIWGKFLFSVFYTKPIDTAVTET